MENCSQNKLEYYQLCDLHPEIPLFLQAWWMDGVCYGKAWDVILLKNEKNEVLAFMPYLLRKKWGMRIIIQPLLSQTNGLWIFYSGEDSVVEKKKLECRLADVLACELSKLNLDWYFQYFHSQSSIPILLESKGFELSYRRTYVIQNLNHPEELFKTFSSAKRRQIKKAQRNGLRADFNISPEEFVQFHTFCLNQKGENNFHSEALEISLCRKAIERSQGAIIRIVDREENLHAALFFVWDSTTAYYLIPAINSNYKSSGASSLMVWEAILKCKDYVSKFDFEGSMDENIARSYKQFGTECVNYAKVERVNSFFIKVLRRLKVSSFK